MAGESATERIRRTMGPVVEVRAVFKSGGQESRFWQYGDAIPDLDQPEWMDDPHKTWAHPQDPIVFSFLVEPGHEDEARAWLQALS